MKKVLVTLEIVYDDKSYNPPQAWDWSDLLDFWKEEESVRVVSYEEISNG